MKKLVMFDYDRTLAQTDRLIAKAALLGYGRELAEKALSIPGLSDRGTIMLLSPSPEEGERLYGKYLEAYAAVRREDGMELCRPLLKAASVLRAKGIGTAVVTGRAPETLSDELDEGGLRGLFDGFYADGPSDIGKDRIIRQCMADFGVSPRDALYVGDDPCDVAACRRCLVDIVGTAYWSADKEKMAWLCGGRTARTQEDAERIILETALGGE